MKFSKKNIFLRKKRILLNNKRVSFDYFIYEKYFAGIMLLGNEVKSIRLGGNVAINNAYVMFKKDGMYLINSYIENVCSLLHKYDIVRPRKLLLKSYEILKLFKQVKLRGYTIVVSSLFFDFSNLIKLELALVKGKKKHDKRFALKEKDLIKE